MADRTLHTLSLSLPIARALSVCLPHATRTRTWRAPRITLPAYDRAAKQHAPPIPFGARCHGKASCVTHSPHTLALALVPRRRGS